MAHHPVQRESQSFGLLLRFALSEHLVQNTTFKGWHSIFDIADAHVFGQVKYNFLGVHSVQNLYEAEFGKENVNADSTAQLQKSFNFLHRNPLLAEAQQNLNLQLSPYLFMN